MSFLTADDRDAGITLIKEINPLEALVKWYADDAKYARRTLDGLTVGARPTEHYTYIVRTKDTDLARKGLSALGIHSTGSGGAIVTNVLECRQEVIIEKYSLPGDVTVALSEEQIEAVPGVIKVIRYARFTSPAEYVYRDGELYNVP